MAHEKIKALIERKKNGIDCTEAESAEIKGWIKDTLIGTDTGEVEIVEDIQTYFPQEYGEALDEMDKMGKGGKAGKKKKSIWEALDFENIERYYDYIHESYVNGNFTQVEELMDDMTPDQRKGFFRHAREMGYSETINWINEKMEKGGKAGREKVTYEIKAYSTIKDFNERKGDLLDEFIPTKSEAQKLAKKEYESGKYAAVKLQSSDREFIQMYPAVFDSMEKGGKTGAKKKKSSPKKYSDKFEEIYDWSSRVGYAKDFGSVIMSDRDGENDTKIPLLVVAKILDIYDATGDDEFKDTPFEVSFEIAPYPEYIDEKHYDGVRKSSGIDVMDKDMLFADLMEGYMGGVPILNDKLQHLFETQEEAEKYIKSKEVAEILGGIEVMIGFYLDGAINRIGDTRWSYLIKMVDEDGKRFVYSKGGKAGKEMVAEAQYRDADNYKTQLVLSIPSGLKIKVGDDVDVKKFGIARDEWQNFISNTMMGEGWKDDRDHYEVEILDIREMKKDDMPVNGYEKGGKVKSGGSNFWDNYANDGLLITGGSVFPSRHDFGGTLLGGLFGLGAGYIWGSVSKQKGYPNRIMERDNRYYKWDASKGWVEFTSEEYYALTGGNLYKYNFKEGYHQLKIFEKGGKAEGRIITFDDGFQFRVVDFDYAKKNWQKEAIYKIYEDEQSESLVDDIRRVYPNDVLGVEIGFKKEKGGKTGDEKFDIYVYKLSEGENEPSDYSKVTNKVKSAVSAEEVDEFLSGTDAEYEEDDMFWVTMAGERKGIDYTQYLSRGGSIHNKKYGLKKVSMTKRGKGIDSKVKAKPAGWRKSEKTGDWYFEARANRADKSRRSKL